MRFTSFVITCSALLATSALAQTVIGKATQVEGIVTMTDGVRGGTLVVGSPITDGSRVVTSSNGNATLRLDSGCTITLKPNQAVTVRDRPCEALLVQSIGGAGGVLAGVSGSGGSAAVGAASVLALGAGGALLNNQLLDNRPISSN